MNYSLRLKEELIAGAPRAACCRRAFAAGLLFDLREYREGCLVLTVSSAAARRECARVFREQYHGEALLGGGAMLFASDKLYDSYREPPCLSCRACAGHFLRGLLVSCGSVTDPQKAYHLEFRLSNAEKLPILTDFFSGYGWKMRCRPLDGRTGLYTKNSTVMEEIFTVVGTNQALFALMNAKITRDIRNEENRATNCVTRNIRRTIGASGRICEAIGRLEAAGRLAALPEELRQTARLRQENPDAPLSELAQMHDPPITKSGLNHRLARIAAYAEALKDEPRG